MVAAFEKDRSSYVQQNSDGKSEADEHQFSSVNSEIVLDGRTDDGA